MKTLWNIALCLVGVSIIGCDPMEKKPKPAAGAHDHEHSHHGPESFTEAVADIEKHQKTIKEAFSNSKPEDAHDALHDIGHSIEALVELGKKQGIEAADLQTINKASEDLMMAFGAVDETLHGGKGKNYDEVAEQVDAAITSIKTFLKP